MLPPGQLRLKTESHLESLIADFFKRKQTQGNRITEKLKHSAKVLVVNSLVMRRLGRFKDKQTAAEGERWVKREWENMEEPEPGNIQQHSAKVAVNGLKRGQDVVNGREEEFYGKRIKSSHATLSVGSPVSNNGSKKLFIDLTQDEEEESSGEEGKASCLEPGVAFAS